MTSPDCLLAEELRALRDGCLERDLEESANAHLDDCSVCRELYYELPEQALPLSPERAVSEEEISAFAERVKVRAATFLAADRAPSATVVSFTKPSWSGVRLAAHTTAARALLVSPSDGVRVLETEELELRVVEFQEDHRDATGGTLVLIEATLTPTTPYEFSAVTDVAVTTADGKPLEPLDVLVRPLVWTGTFAGGGMFVIRVALKDVVVRVDVQRPR